jgi:dienelactone hydrolase
MRRLIASALGLLATSTVLHAQSKSIDAAAAFGTRPSVLGLTLAPDAKSVAYIIPSKAAGTAVITQGLDKEAKARVAATADGNPLRVTDCRWVTNDRLVCTALGVNKDPTWKFLPFSRKLSFDANGGNPQQLGQFGAPFGFGIQTGGEVIDTVPAEGAVLMTRMNVPMVSTATYTLSVSGAMQRGTSTQNGLGVDSMDTRTMTSKSVEPPADTAVSYLADGHGAVRIMAVDPSRADGGGGFGGGFGGPPGGKAGGVINYMYRAPGSHSWQRLSTFNMADPGGFRPLAVDSENNVAYGLKRKNGHAAVYTVKLDDSLAETLVYARDDTDLTGLVQVGPQQWVVGATYAGKTPGVHYFEPVEQTMASLVKAINLQDHPQALRLVDASADRSKLLLLASSDADPGIYYIFDRAAKRLDTFLPVRKPLEDARLVTPKAVSYPASDGVSVTAQLLLPPGKENAKGLPAVVLSDVGTGARDPQGFDWLAQFFASRGYAVLLPDYRGDVAFGDAWSLPAYPSWSVAVGDVVAGARYLVSSGVADAKKLAVAGWSYGGYAALESTVVEPDLFKAAIAIAPVTNLATLKDNRMLPAALINAFVGSGSSVQKGSPIDNAAAIRTPVLMFHGGMDMIVHVEESKAMDAKLKSAGKPHELVTWDTLDHQLEDSEARIEMLRKSEAFLRKSLGL